MLGVTKIQFRATFVLTFYNKNVQKYLFKNVKSDVSYTRGQDSGNSSMSRIVCTSYFPLPFPGGVACALKTDYGNFVLVRLPAYLQRRLQSVLNAAARLVFHLSRYDHVSDALATLRWLRLPQRVDFKVAVVAFYVVHGLAPPYLNDLVRVATCPVVADFARHHHINCLFHHSGSQPSVDAHFQSLRVTNCHLTSNHPRLCPSSVNVLKHSFFVSVFPT